MTWSIIAKEPATGRLGVIVASKFFAVGSMVPHIRTGVGAVASQAFVNPFYGPRGLAMMQAGSTAAEVINLLTVADEGRDNRQVHAMDTHGNVHAYTGANCVDWCGHVVRDGFSVAGNMLAGAAVIEDTAAEFAARTELPLARRLIAAMLAGERAGGDKRGKQSAALLIHDGEDYPLYDLRVDDHADPFAELNMSGRLSELAQQAPDSWPTIFRVGSTIPGSDYVNALRLRARLQQEMNAVMKDIDVLISVPLEGPAIYITNLTGHPTVVTRCGTNKNMPESIEFIGGLDQEAAILRLAHAYEKATLHHKQWPDMSKVVV